MSKQNVIRLNGKTYDAATGKLIEDAKTPKKPIKHATKTKKKKKTMGSDVVKAKARPRNHAIHHRTQKSKTLNRTPLKKPHKTKPQTQPKSAHITAKDERAERAKQIQRSPSLAKYSHHVKKVNKRYDHLPVVNSPHGQTPVKRQPTQVEKEFNRVMAQSNAHEQPKHHHIKLRKKRSFAKPVAIASAALLLIAFFGYQNIPNLSMRIASSRAGFDANHPGFTPNGYSTGPINYETGRVVINFRSNTNSNSYALTQKVSGWNSEALLHNYLLENDMKYQSQQVKGKTIYLYDNSSATWVNGGVWFNIESENLTNDQLVRIAASL